MITLRRMTQASKLIVFTRNMSLKVSTKPSPVIRPCKEVVIPVPWGHIAARDWGPLEGEKEDGVPWIGIHGWLDNAGTFEPLLAHLPKGRR